MSGRPARRPSTRSRVQNPEAPCFFSVMTAARSSAGSKATPKLVRSCQTLLAVECLRRGEAACRADALGNIGSGNIGWHNFGRNNAGSHNIGNNNAGNKNIGSWNQGDGNASSPSRFHKVAAPTQPQAGQSYSCSNQCRRKVSHLCTFGG
ncbi:hypothetical protein ACKKBF_B40295 [Auxenochlorella protothecoides x Auxenochlorella symbiontica]